MKPAVGGHLENDGNPGGNGQEMEVSHTLGAHLTSAFRS